LHLVCDNLILVMVPASLFPWKFNTSLFL
jgi:hypothetical protein